MMKVKINFTPYYEWYAKWIDWKKGKRSIGGTLVDLPIFLDN